MDRQPVTLRANDPVCGICLTPQADLSAHWDAGCTPLEIVPTPSGPVAEWEAMTETGVWPR